MTELIDRVRELAPTEGRQFIEALAADEKGRELISPTIDRAVNKAVSSAREKVKAEADATIAALHERLEAATPIEKQSARLDAIEKAYQAKAERLGLEYRGRARALELGLPWELVGRFDDEVELNERLDTIASLYESHARAAVNSALLDGHKPGSGDSETLLRARDLDGMNADDIQSAYKAGRISGLT
jgi:hypothetical protein